MKLAPVRKSNTSTMTGSNSNKNLKYHLCKDSLCICFSENLNRFHKEYYTHFITCEPASWNIFVRWYDFFNVKFNQEDSLNSCKFCLLSNLMKVRTWMTLLFVPLAMLDFYKIQVHVTGLYTAYKSLIIVKVWCKLFIKQTENIRSIWLNRGWGKIWITLCYLLWRKWQSDV